MSAPAWLTARPIAHRGLHDAARGILENTASAALAAISGNYGIEADLQISADGEAMVFHDDELERLTEGNGPVREMTAAQLGRLSFKQTADRMLTLGEFCDLVAGRTALFLELKSRFDGDRRIALRAMDVLKTYTGPVALMSFDPVLIALVRRQSPGLVRGIVAQRHYRNRDWRALSPALRRACAYLWHLSASRPHFLAYNVADLPAAPVTIARAALGLPLLTWTVRSAADRAHAARYADQIIFEGFRA